MRCMKTPALILALSLAAVGVSSASAQVYRPAVTNGTVLGAIAGAFVGGHNHDRWAEGTIIGAAAGALIGSTVPAPQTVVYERPAVTTVVQTAPTIACAPVVQYAPTYSAPACAAPAQTVVVQQPPQVVYYTPAPAQVVYVERAPVVYYRPAPVVRIGVGYSYYGGRDGGRDDGHRHGGRH